MARLYSNENFPYAVVKQLRRLGHDVITIQETGKADQRTTDEEVMRYANADDRAVLTLNRRHFVNLHNTNPQHAGIIVCSVDADFLRMADRIHKFLESFDSLSGKLVRVNRPVQ